MSADDEIPHVSVPDAPPTPAPALRPDLVRDLVLFGSAYVEEGTGRRIDPMCVIRRPDGSVLVGLDPARPVRAVPSSSAVARVHEALQRMFREMVPVVRRLSETMSRLGRAAGIAAEPEPLDPRERALRARQTRNTGPARDPFTHRGSHEQRHQPRSRVQQPSRRRIPPRAP